MQDTALARVFASPGALVGYTALGVPVFMRKAFCVFTLTEQRAYRAGRAYIEVAAPDETTDAKVIQTISLYEAQSGS